MGQLMIDNAFIANFSQLRRLCRYFARINRSRDPTQGVTI
jgi:hypothetical protein